ncbi:sensor domain-containing protein [Paenibacillus filicis]|uniref:Sensor domain-containing protein n=1 Tax=Paenibacillus filicis TaxID=669464 RepID=A0ABU9DWZ0_9BACL
MMNAAPQPAAIGWNQSFLIKMQYFLVMTLPLGILGFAFTIVFFTLGVALTPIGIGIPILYFALIGCRRLQDLDARALGRPDQPGEFDPSGETAQGQQDGMGRMKAVLLSLESYLPVLYWIIKLPLSIIQFVLAVTFPVVGIILLFAPLVYMAAAQWYGYDLFSGDMVMDMLLPMATPQQRSYVVAGIGFVWFLLGIYVVNRMFRASIWFVGAWGK